MKTIPLSPMLGHRFNIIYKNAGGVYYLRKHLADFSRENLPNRLHGAIVADLAVPTYLAGIRSLGLIYKMVTDPLERLLNTKAHVSTITDHYKTMHDCFKVFFVFCKLGF